MGIGIGRLLRNDLVRRPYRNLTIALCFAFISGSVLSSAFLMEGTESSIENGMARIGADLMVVPYKNMAQSEAAILTGVPSTFMFGTDVYDTVSSVEGVKAACPQIYIATLSNQACCSEPVQLIGFNQSLDFTVQPWLESELGRSLQKDEIIVGGFIIGDVGTQLMFYGHNFTIAGRLERTGMGIDCSIFIRDLDAYVMAAESAEKAAETLELTPGMISAVLIKVDGNANRNVVATNIKMAAPQVTVFSSDTLMDKVSGQVSGATRPLLLSSALVALASVPLIAAITVMSVYERRSEIGVLRMVGASRRQVFSIIVLEAVALAAVGSIMGSSLATILLYSFQPAIAAQLGIPFMWPSLGTGALWMALICLAAMGIGALAALYPAIKASRLDPYEVMREADL